MNDKELEPGYYTDYEGTKPARIGDKVALCVPLKELPGNTPSADKDLADARLERAVRAALEAAARMVDCGCDKAQKARAIAAEAPNGGPRWMACGEANCGAIDASAIRALDPAHIVKGVKDE